MYIGVYIQLYKSIVLEIKEKRMLKKKYEMFNGSCE